MSRGRFTLQRAKDPTDARAKAGLDIEASDTYTGTTRPVSSCERKLAERPV